MILSKLRIDTQSKEKERGSEDESNALLAVEETIQVIAQGEKQQEFLIICRAPAAPYSIPKL